MTTQNMIEVPYSTTPTASTLAEWDTNKNLSANNLIEAYATTAIAASTTALTVSSKYQQYFTGSTTQTVTLPTTASLVLGQSFYIVNNSTGVVTVESYGTNTIQAMAGSTTLLVTCISTSVDTAAGWNAQYLGETSGGTVNPGTINDLAYYAATGDAVSALATADNGILVTSATGVPSIATTFGQGLAVSSSELSVGGANNIPFNNGQGIQDNNSHSLLLFGVTASAVNSVNLTNAATSGSPTFSASGSDTNIILTLKGQGTGGVTVQGTGTNNNAASGYVGQFVSNSVTAGSPVSLTSTDISDVCTISLTAGDWDVWANVFFQFSSGATDMIGWINTSSATQPSGEYISRILDTLGNFTRGGLVVPYQRMSISSTTTIYLSGNSTFASGTGSIAGTINARRAR